MALFFVTIISCKSAFNSVSDNMLGDRYTYISHNPKHNIKFHSLGGRKNINRLFYKKYGTLVFINKDYLGGNKLFSSLFIIDKIPEEITKKKMIKIELYNTNILCYENQHGNFYERYFQYKNFNYVFVTKFQKIAKNTKYDWEDYISQEMRGLEL